MNLLELCNKLDSFGFYHMSDTLMTRFSMTKQEFMDKRILIPMDVKMNSKEAYDKRLGDLKFGGAESYEFARQLSLNYYVSLEDIVKIHKYLQRNRNSANYSETNPLYWEYQLYGGEEARKWAENMVRIYVPEKWRFS
jgi:hypothetical protein